MKILIAGAVGHIGSRTIRDLPAAFPGCELLMIDNMSSQRYPSLFNLPKNVNYRFVEADILKADVKGLLQGCDVVISLAAITDAAGSFDKAAAVEENNYGVTVRLAEACIETGAAIIVPSSTSVYGSQASVVDEDCAETDLQPQSPYADTKLKEERLIADLVANKGLRGVVLRLGTIFGISPGMRFHTAVNKFCWQAVTGQPITVWSTAYDQKRPYLDLGDCVRALEFIIKSSLFDGRVYNVVTSNHTVRDVVETIRTHIPDLEVGFVDSRIMNQLSYEVLNRRMTDKGFTFEGSLAKGIAETIALMSSAAGR